MLLTHPTLLHRVSHFIRTISMRAQATSQAMKQHHKQADIRNKFTQARGTTTHRTMLSIPWPSTRAQTMPGTLPHKKTPELSKACGAWQ